MRGIIVAMCLLAFNYSEAQLFKGLKDKLEKTVSNEVGKTLSGGKKLLGNKEKAKDAKGVLTISNVGYEVVTNNYTLFAHGNFSPDDLKTSVKDYSNGSIIGYVDAFPKGYAGLVVNSNGLNHKESYLEIHKASKDQIVFSANGKSGFGDDEKIITADKVKITITKVIDKRTFDEVTTVKEEANENNEAKQDAIAEEQATKMLQNILGTSNSGAVNNKMYLFNQRANVVIRSKGQDKPTRLSFLFSDKEQYSAIDISGVNGVEGKGHVVMDGDKVTMFVKANGLKLKRTSSQQQVDAMLGGSQLGSDTSIVKTGEKKEINEFNCEKYIATYKGQISEIWVTKDVKLINNQILGLKLNELGIEGTLIQLNSYDGSSIEVKNIAEVSLIINAAKYQSLGF